MSKPILCLDFDGVIHSYTSGWVEVDFIPDPPVPGVFEFMLKALEHFTVVIFSSRSKEPAGIRAMRIYVQHWAKLQLPNDEASKWAANTVINKISWNNDAWPTTKPAAFLTIDDRALQFHGRWEEYDVQDLLKFRPWNKT